MNHIPENGPGPVRLLPGIVRTRNLEMSFVEESLERAMDISNDEIKRVLHVNSQSETKLKKTRK